MIMKYINYRLALICCILLLSLCVSAQTYLPTNRGSKLEFNFKQGKGETLVQSKATFSSVLGLIQFDPKQLQHASFDLSVTTTGLSTMSKTEGARLKGADFFDVADYPVINIKSTSVTQDAPGSVVYIVAASLTIKGITKPVKIQLTCVPSGTGYMFHGLMQFSRMAYGLGEKNDFDDIVPVFLQINTTKK